MSSRVLFVVLLAAVVAVTRDSSTAFLLGIWRSRSVLLGDPAGPAGAEMAEPPRYETTRGRASYSQQFPGDDSEAAPEWPPPGPPLSAKAAAAADANVARSSERRDGQSLPDIVVWAKGPLHDRLDALCAGYSVGALLSAASVATSTATEAQGDAETASFTASASASTVDGVLPLPLQLAFSANDSRSSSPRAPLHRALRVAVLWLPEPALPHSRVHHLLAPLPPLSALAPESSGEAEGTGGQEGQRGQDGEGEGAPSGRDAATVLYQRPGWLDSTRYTPASITLRIPQPASSTDDRQSSQQASSSSTTSHPSRPLRLSLFLASSLSPLLPSLSSLDQSQLHTSLHRCYSLLQPSQPVQRLIAKENMTRIRQSTGVYLEPVSLSTNPSSPSPSPSASVSASASALPSASPRPTCASCPPSLLVNCTARRLMWFFLRAPHADATVAAFFPSQALAVARSFHANRQPHLLSTTLRRAALCRPNPQWGEAAPPEVPAAALSIKESEKRWWVKQMVRRMLVSGEEAEGEDYAHGNARGSGKGRPRRQSILCARLEAAELFALSQARGLIHAQHSPQADLVRAQARARGAVVVVRDVNVAPESEPMADDGEQGEAAVGTGQSEGVEEGEEGRSAGGEGGVGEREAAGGEGGRGSEGNAWAGGDGAGGRAATRRLSAMDGSSDGEGGGAEEVWFEAERALCDAPAMKPITEHRVGQQLIVDESLGVFYCAVPKAACTSWKMWMRQQHHDPNAADRSSVHRPYRSHLPAVWFGMSEPEAIRAVTRRDLVRFVFVRNPFSRLVSAYMDKVVQGEGIGMRIRIGWTMRFFFRLATVSRQTHRPFALSDLAHPSRLTPALSPWGALRLMLGAVVSFKEFARLVEEARRMDDLVAMDNHLAPQTSVCGLNHIKYDVVGRFEHMQQDVQQVLSALGKPAVAQEEQQGAEAGRGRKVEDPFAAGKGVHFTNSSNRVFDMIQDKETYLRVKRVYAMDMHSTLNDLHYNPPADLAKKFEG
ncbi:unnamed protein product [Closterium sp. NIES-64]|nr:unnamed protein product [Closterium sp. NIES-64]